MTKPMDDNMEDMYDEDLELVRVMNTTFIPSENNILSTYTAPNILDSWPRRRNMCVIQVMCYIAHALFLLQLQSPNPDRYVKSQFKKLSMSIKNLIEAVKDGNYYYERQTLLAKRNAEMMQRQVELAEIAQRGMTIVQESRPRQYTEQDVWSEIEYLNVRPDLKMKSYQFLCRDEQARREFFGVPREIRLNTLEFMLNEAGII